MILTVYRVLEKEMDMDICWCLPKRLLLFGAFSYLMCFVAASRGVAQQPNIILFMADDLGWVDVSTGNTNMGNPSDFYETPALEMMAAQGISFNNAYSNGPNCAPTRAALLSGQYGPRPTNNIFNVDNLNRGTGSLIGPSQGLPNGQDELPATTFTIAEMLQAAGYTTAHLGKYHVGGSLPNNGPLQQGFDANFGGGPSGGPGAYHASQSGGTWRFARGVGPELDTYAAPYTQQYIDNNIAPYNQGADLSLLMGRPKHVTDALADAAIDFMDDNLSTPFFLNYSEFAVHSPFSNAQARPDLLGKYQAKQQSNPSQMGHNSPAYASLVENFDQSVARLVNYLNTTPDPRNQGHNLSDNTLVIFYSDNGGLTTVGVTENGPLQGEKGELVEGGIRVPMIAWGPGGLVNHPGTISSQPVTTIDFYATFADLAGATLPANYTIDGESLAPIFSGSSATLSRESIFWHFPGYLTTAGRNQRPQTVIRKGSHKLFFNYEDQSYELYDLSNDLGEVDNLLAGQVSPLDMAIAAEMSQDLIDWLVDTTAPLPLYRNGQGEVPLPVALLATIAGDFNQDNSIDLNDWFIFRTNLNRDVTSLTPNQAFLIGDMNRDLFINNHDFVLFKSAYEAFNGPGSFTAASSVPEPTAWSLLLISCLLLMNSSKRNKPSI